MHKTAFFTNQKVQLGEAVFKCSLLNVLFSFLAPSGENSMNTAANPFNSSSVVVSWSPPQNPQGVITRYVIFKYQPPSNTTAVRATEVPGSQSQGVVVELMPYTQYKFTVRACNSYDCSGHSPQALARTHPAGMLYKAAIFSPTVFVSGHKYEKGICFFI